MDHLDQHSILSDKQHSFRSKHSTETQLILTTHNLSKSLNNKSQIDMIIMDLSKAFDTAPQYWLLNKLKRYDINNKTHACISKLLTCREQRVVVSGEHSPLDPCWVWCTTRHSTRPIFSSWYTSTIYLTLSTPHSVCLQMTVSCTEKLTTN